ncbi:ArnT family glycosyltransferase, partial [Sciscionella sediminilitoris]|uniref:ArnT family glycosyltransferase n=1 Tax=Sciscionella sediminilitoris TaxID=1445613 RepID=UPI0018D0E4ED
MTTRMTRRVPVTARWQLWALGTICAATALLYGWRIGAGQVGNSYYAAAAKSMAQSFPNFLFGSFDPQGVETVDKPPMALWPQAFSVWLFGFHGWSVLLPQVIEGVAAVFLLQRTVRRWAGDNVALLAAGILALTPITVAVNRSNDTDTLLDLLLIAAVYAVTRSIEADRGGPRTRWLLCCAFLVGAGFVTKMLQAWIIVPALALAYLGTATAPWRRRVLELGAAGGVLIVSSFWWVALHDLWPGRTPFVSGSTDGTAWDLVFGYNGFGRILGQAEGPGNGAKPGPGGGMTMMQGQDAGLGRLFSAEVGGQISWLL